MDGEELEVSLLAHLVTTPQSLDKALEKGISEEHFIHKDESSGRSFTQALYRLILKYHENSGGSMLTENVLELQMNEHGTPQSARGKLTLLWAQMEDVDVDPNDLHEIVMQLKNRRSSLLATSMVKDATDAMAEEGIAKMIEVTRDYLDQIEVETNDTLKARQRLDVANEGAEYLWDEYLDRLQNPDKYKGIPSGFNGIDEKTFGLRPAQMMLVLAPTGGGKSVILLNMAHAAHRAGFNVLYLSFEMEMWQCLLRHISLSYECSYRQLKSVRYTKDDVREIADRMSVMKGGSYFEYDVNMEDATAEYIDARVRELIATKGKPDLVVVDYMGNMSSRASRRDAKDWEKQGDAYAFMKKLTKRHGISILTAQQINRATFTENRKKREDGKATSFGQDSASGDQRLTHLSDYIIVVESHKEDKIAIVYSTKGRDAPFEPFVVGWDADQNYIHELGPEDNLEWLRRKGLIKDQTENATTGGKRGNRGPNEAGETTSVDELVFAIPEAAQTSWDTPAPNINDENEDIGDPGWEV